MGAAGKEGPRALGARKWRASDHGAARHRLARMVESERVAKSKSDEFYDKVEGQRFQHPETGNRVLFWSLPDKEQKKIRERYDQGQETGGTEKANQKPTKAPSAFADWLGSVVGDQGSSGRHLKRKLKGLAEKGKLDDAQLTQGGVRVKSLDALAEKAGHKQGVIPHRNYADAMRDAGKWDDDQHNKFMTENALGSPEQTTHDRDKSKKEREEAAEKKHENEKREKAQTQDSKHQNGLENQRQDDWQKSDEHKTRREQLQRARDSYHRQLKQVPPGASHEDKRNRLKQKLKQLDREDNTNQKAPKDWKPKRWAAAKDPGGDKWKGPLPKGWTDASRKKFWDSLTSAAPKHKVTECIEKMKGTDITDPGAFCASLADRVIPGWREEAAKDRKKKALEELDEVMANLNQPLKTRRDYGKLPPEEKDPDKKHSTLPGADTMSVGDQETESPTKLAASAWISREEMERLCPPCAEKMRKAGFKRVRASTVERMLRQTSG